MPALVPSSPLMALISYHGQEYYTSHYFHRVYLANSPQSTKYRQHAHFTRRIRAIDAFEDYVNSGDILELQWHSMKAEANPIRDCFLSLFKATGYQPLMLLNATAQAELTHHLDDEVSRQMAMASSRLAARQHSLRAGGSGEIEQRAANALRGLMDAASILGTPLYLAQQEAVKYVDAKHGIDFRPFLLAAPAQDHIAEADVMLEPTELAAALDVPSAIGMNRLLAAMGFQVRAIGGGWEPTPAGQPFCAQHAWTRENKTGFNWKWKREAIREALTVYRAAQQATP